MKKLFNLRFVDSFRNLSHTPSLAIKEVGMGYGIMDCRTGQVLSVFSNRLDAKLAEALINNYCVNTYNLIQLYWVMVAFITGIIIIPVVGLVITWIILRIM